MKKLFKYNLIIIFIFLIFAIPILTISHKNNHISNIENRTLATIPEYSKERLFNGEYFSDLENYVSDHIIGRDKIIKSYTLLNMKILGKRKINNIIIGKENTLLPYYTEELSQNLENNLNNIPTMIENINKLNKSIKSYDGEFLFVGLPGQSSFFRDRYQDYFENKQEYFDENESKMFQELGNKEINYINMNQIFAQEPNKEYYLKTDHHYSFKGSYITYVEIIKNLKDDLNLNIREPLKVDELNIATLENPILGSRNKQIYFLQHTDEKISIAYPKDTIEYEKITDGTSDPTLYYFDNENLRPSYSIYMGGDHSEIIIDTNREGLPNLLLFGDSFTNALEPLLYYHFNQTRILDLRHYKKMDLYEYINLHKPDIVIMVRDDLNYGNLNGNGKF